MVTILSRFSALALLFYVLATAMLVYLFLFMFKINQSKRFEKHIRVFSLLLHLLIVILANYFVLLSQQDLSGVPGEIVDSFLLHWEYKVKFSLGFAFRPGGALVYALISDIILWRIYKMRYNIRNHTKYTFWLLLFNIILLLYTSFYGFREFN